MVEDIPYIEDALELVVLVEGREKVKGFGVLVWKV